jgi:hypothetical protein
MGLRRKGDVAKLRMAKLVCERAGRLDVMKEKEMLRKIKESLIWKRIPLNFDAVSRLVVWVSIVILLLGCACVRRSSSSGVTDYELARREFVTVYLDGDVKFYGERKIRRELSERSILEASGGFAGLSQIRPKSITFKRGTQRYNIPFSKLGTGRWKNFLLQDGDEIVVNKVWF